MAKQKRKESRVAEKKSKNLKVSAAQTPPAPAAPPGAGTAPAEGPASASVSPEEQRVLERKLKKERRKEARRRLREAGIAAAPSPASKLALEYLCSWAQKHKEWRFQKTRQTWLLLHMYERDQVPDEHFPALLAYLEGLRGHARELTLQKAEALMRELDQAGACSLPPGGTQRARQVLQLLS